MFRITNKMLLEPTPSIIIGQLSKKQDLKRP